MQYGSLGHAWAVCVRTSMKPMERQQRLVTVSWYFWRRSRVWIEFEFNDYGLLWLARVHSLLYRLQMVIMYVLSCGVVCLHEFTLRTPTDFQDSRQNKKTVWLLGLQYLILSDFNVNLSWNIIIFCRWLMHGRRFYLFAYCTTGGKSCNEL